MTKPLGQQLYELVKKCEFSHGDLEYKEMMAWEEAAQRFLETSNKVDGEVDEPVEESLPEDSMDTLSHIQKQIGEWAREQFGLNISKWTGQILGSLMSLGGMTEEIGELWHATIYRHQGRGFTTDAEYKAAIKDGLGDLLVFMSDYAEREDVDLSDTLKEVWEKVSKRRQKSWLEDKANEESVENNYFVPPGCDQPKPEPAEVLHPPHVWCKRLGVEIMDADGWNYTGSRDPQYKSWHDPICLEEFVVRCVRSDCRLPFKGQMKEISEILHGMTYKTIEQGVSCLKLHQRIAEIGGPETQQAGQGWAEPLCEEEAQEYEERRDYRQHDLYKKGDTGAPDSIKDSNGDIALGLCKVCGRAEVELDEDGGQCPGKRLVPKESTVTENLFSEGPGYYRNNWGPDGREVVKLTGEEVEKMFIGKEGHHMMDCSLGNNQADPHYIYGRSREKAGDGVIHNGASEQLFPEGPGTDMDPSHWTDEPMNGFDVARDIATQYAEGQNRLHALKTIDAHEKIYKEHQAQCKHEDPDRSGYCIKCQAEL